MAPILETTLIVTSSYSYVLLVAALSCLLCIVAAGAAVGRTRAKVFNKEFMEANFGQLHSEETGEALQGIAKGYPDMGNGRFSKKLAYKDWLQFNRAQRVHYHSVELLAPELTLLLLAGLYQPILASFLGFLFLVGQICYFGYLLPNGPKNTLTLMGRLLTALPLPILLILAIRSGLAIKRWAEKLRI